ncbi:MAG: OmpA family protein [Bradymonadaceae bacterium]
MSWRRTLWLLSIVLFTVVALMGCKPDYPNCKKDSHCEGNEQAQAEGRLMCVNQLCQQCATTADCGDESMECSAGMCERIPGYCVGTNDCPGNQVCRDKRCGPECLGDTDCADGYECQGGNCTVKPECTVDTDCDGDMICRGGKCTQPPETACSLETVYFSYDSSHLDNSSRQVLQRNAECIKEREIRVQIAGHCDERGTSEYNIALGERRARSVRNYLTSLGIRGNDLSTISYGQERLVRQCGEEGPDSCHRVNRRAEFGLR